jgi:hypothetical protein
MCLNEPYSKVHRGRQLSDTYPIRKGPKQLDALSSLPFNCALCYAIMTVQENMWD